MLGLIGTAVLLVGRDLQAFPIKASQLASAKMLTSGVQLSRFVIDSGGQAVEID
jgi:hypothetical protein